MDLKYIALEKRGRTGLISFNHPPANAWSLAAVEDLQRAVDALDRDPEVRVIIFTGGGGKHFSAGYDISDTADPGVTSPLARALWQRIDRLDKPTIAALNGHAVGGGLELALCCHFRVMTDAPGAKLGLTELRVGILPGWGGTQRLARLVGRGRALEMIMFSRLVSAVEALEMGLVNRIVPADQLLAKALDLADELAQKPPLAVKWLLRAISTGEYEGLDQGLNTEAQGSAACRGSQDRQEGFRAFLEKRPPVFTGR